ncbi:MAG: cytochrome C [Thermodesulfovibrio sp.]|nr:cytochrome C [Thermodesulfovibrio sp.]
MTNKSSLLLVAAGALVSLFLIIMFADMPDGAEIFKREGCSSCHSFRGSGGSAGPELTAVSKRRDDTWIRRQIRDPKSHNPGTTMPSFSHLSRKETSALINYLKQDSGKTP